MQQRGSVSVNPERLIAITQKQLAEANARAAQWQAIAEELLAQQAQAKPAQADQPDKKEEVTSGG